MTIDLSAHRVVKIIIGPEFKFQSGDAEMISRDVDIVFAGGGTQRIECYAAADHTIELEIKNEQ